MNESATTKRVAPLAATASGPRRVRAISELPGPRGLPELGNLLQLNTGRMHTILSAWADEFGPLYRYRIANKNALVVSDTALINEVLRNGPEGFGAPSDCKRSSWSSASTECSTPKAPNGGVSESWRCWR